MVKTIVQYEICTGEQSATNQEDIFLTNFIRMYLVRTLYTRGMYLSIAHGYFRAQKAGGPFRSRSRERELKIKNTALSSDRDYAAYNDPS